MQSGTYVRLSFQSSALASRDAIDGVQDGDLLPLHERRVTSRQRTQTGRCRHAASFTEPSCAPHLATRRSPHRRPRRDSPRAIASQNFCRCSRHATGGRPRTASPSARSCKTEGRIFNEYATLFLVYAGWCGSYLLQKCKPTTECAHWQSRCTCERARRRVLDPTSRRVLARVTTLPTRRCLASLSLCQVWHRVSRARRRQPRRRTCERSGVPTGRASPGRSTSTGLPDGPPGFLPAHAERLPGHRRCRSPRAVPIRSHS